MSFITVEGENKIAAMVAAHTPLDITQFVFANIPSLGIEPVNRIEALPSAGYIVDTKSVANQGYVSPNKVVYSIVLDSAVGDYQFNWVGLKDADGVLIACEHLPLTTKTKTAGLIQGNNLARNFLIEFNGAQSVTGISTPAATWQFNFNNRLLQIDERERLSNFDTYGAAMFFDTGFLVTHSGLVCSMAAGLAFVGGVRCAKTAASTLTVGGFPTDIYIDASLQGDISGVDAVIAFTASTTALVNYTDSLGFAHYVFKIAAISAGGVVTDLRPLWADIYLKRSDQPSQAEAEAGTSISPRAWTATRVKQAIVKNGLIASGIMIVTATGTLPAAVSGGTVVINCATANTQTLPSAAALGVCRIEFVNDGVGAATIQRAGSDVFKVNSTNQTVLVLREGDTLTIESDGVNTYYAVSGSAQLGFSNSLKGNSAIQYFPSGYALQCGYVATTTGGYATIYYPVAYLVSASRDVISMGSNNCVIDSQIMVGNPAFTQYLIKTVTGAVAPVGAIVNYMSYGKVF